MVQVLDKIQLLAPVPPPPPLSATSSEAACNKLPMFEQSRSFEQKDKRENPGLPKTRQKVHVLRADMCTRIEWRAHPPRNKKKNKKKKRQKKKTACVGGILNFGAFLCTPPCSAFPLRCRRRRTPTPPERRYAQRSTLRCRLNHDATGGRYRYPSGRRSRVAGELLCTTRRAAQLLATGRLALAAV